MAGAAPVGIDWPARLLLIGCGNMGGAMLTGWLAAGIAPSRFTIVDPVLDHAPDGVRLLTEIGELGPERFDALLLGIKPQLLDEVAPSLEPLVAKDVVLLSVLAGVELGTLAELFPRAQSIARIMPNLAAAIGKSPVALAHRGLASAQRESITALMAPLGTPEWLEEPLFHAVTALAGSGPAFVYRFVDALAAGGVALGLEPGQAERLALAMADGATALAAASPDRPGDLARKVASPGGTTQAGLDVLDAGDALAQLVQGTLMAAARRSEEMAKAARA